MERFFIKSYDPEQTRRTCDDLLAWLKEKLPEHAEVHEVGSTAVPGAIGKGDLDILVRVVAAEFDATRKCLDSLTPRNPEQLSSSKYQGYLVPNEPDAALQLTVLDGPHDNFLAFLRCLRAQPELVERYNELKRRHDGGAMKDYRVAKGLFIGEILAEHALEEARG